MKLKKTLVMVLAACLMVGVLAGTAFADSEAVAPTAPAGGSDLSIPSSIVKQGATVYNIDLADGTRWGSVKELDTPYTGWKQYGDNWAYYRMGRPQYHWQQIDGNWYYFQKDGFMVANGVAWVENRLYYFLPSGVCDTTPGWKLIEDYFYVYEQDGTQMVYPAQGYAWFYLNENGYIQTGWNWIDGAWHMCDKETGRMLCNEWYWGEADLVYYFDQYTEMATGWMTVTDALNTDYTYRFAADGHQVNGWQQDGGNWYYLRPYMGFAGYRLENTWAFIGTQAGTYWYLFNDDGVMQTGWQEVMTSKATTETRYENGKVYTVQVPAQTKWFYLTSWGAMMKGVQYINGTYYDFGDDGVLAGVWAYNEIIGDYAWAVPEIGASNVLVPGMSDKEKDIMPAVDNNRY